MCSQLFSHFLCHALVYEPLMLCIVGFGPFMSEHKPVRSLRSYLVLSLWFLWWLTLHLWGFFKAVNSVLGQNHTDKKNFVLSVRLILAANICISVLAVTIVLMRGKKRNSGLQILHTAFVCALVTWLICFFILTAFYTSIQGDREWLWKVPKIKCMIIITLCFVVTWFLIKTNILGSKSKMHYSKTPRRSFYTKDTMRSSLLTTRCSQPVLFCHMLDKQSTQEATFDSLRLTLLRKVCKCN